MCSKNMFSCKKYQYFSVENSVFWHSKVFLVVVVHIILQPLSMLCIILQSGDGTYILLYNLTTYSEDPNQTLYQT